MFTDTNFPLIDYEKGKSFLQWGQSHGEEFKTAIKELVEIRRELMLARNPNIKEHINALALEQFRITENFSPSISQELLGIAEGSDLTIEEIVILNNYTDFRDIELPEEGCSTVYKKSETMNMTGQTWDMHSSAKNYVCVIKQPVAQHVPGATLFSLVGCVGMMGVNDNELFIGVNNINTFNAKAGLIWPALVRKCLMSVDLDEMRTILTTSPVTSGHNYLISDANTGEHWEVAPTNIEKVRDAGQDQHMFHTNHCLGPKMKEIEDPKSHSSTTDARFSLLTNKYDGMNSTEDFISLLKDHDGYPKSICSHYESGAQDPSMTCGGGTYDFQTGKFHLWRGCPVHDNNYKEYNFQMR
jgi:isopenicillin-N N-acyltransferase-like protein